MLFVSDIFSQGDGVFKHAYVPNFTYVLRFLSYEPEMHPNPLHLVCPLNYDFLVGQGKLIQVVSCFKALSDVKIESGQCYQPHLVKLHVVCCILRWPD